MTNGSAANLYPWETEVFKHELARNQVIDGLDETRQSCALVEQGKTPAAESNEDVIATEAGQGDSNGGKVPAGEPATITRSKEVTPGPAGADDDPSTLTYGEKPPFVNEEPSRPSATDRDPHSDPDDQRPGRYRGILLVWRNPYIRGLGALLIVMAIILLGYTLFREPDSGALVRTVTAPTLDDTPGGSVQQDSPQYQETLITFNDEQADLADSEERSFVATTESIPTSLNPVEPVSPLPASESVLEPVVPPEEGALPAGEGALSFADPEEVVPSDGTVAPITEPEPLPAYTPSYFFDDSVPAASPELAIPGSNTVLDTLRELTEIPLPTMRSGLFGTANQEEPAQIGAGVLPGPSSFSSNAVSSLVAGVGGNQGLSGNPFTDLSGETALDTTPVPAELFATDSQINTVDSNPTEGVSYLLPAGTVIYAEMVNGLNSDLPGPAVAEIVEEPLRGARVLGQFTPNLASGGLSLQFQTITMPDGTSQPITAYGLSPWTGENLTRSTLRPRLLQRYGPTMLMAFLSGASSLLLEDGRRIVVANDAVYQERSSKVEDRQIIAAGITALAGQVAADIQAQAPQGPQILLYPGSPLALLFATSVTDTTQPRSLP